MDDETTQLNNDPNKCPIILFVDGKPAYFSAITLDIFDVSMMHITTIDQYAASVTISERRPELTPEKAFEQMREFARENKPIIALWIEHQQCQHVLTYMRISEVPDNLTEGFEYTQDGFDARQSLDEMAENNPLIAALLKSMKSGLN